MSDNEAWTPARAREFLAENKGKRVRDRRSQMIGELSEVSATHGWLLVGSMSYHVPLRLLEVVDEANHRR